MNPAIGGSSIVVVASTLPNKPSISSLNRTPGGTLFMALISSGRARNGAAWFESPGGYQRLFVFTGSLGRHREGRRYRRRAPNTNPVMSQFAARYPVPATKWLVGKPDQFHMGKCVSRPA